MYLPKLSPCYNCERRQIGCHDKCEDYQLYRFSRQKVLEAMSEEHIRHSYGVDSAERRKKKRKVKK